MSTKVTKKIKFGFFECNFICNIDDLKSKIDKLSKSKKEKDIIRCKIYVMILEELKDPFLLIPKIIGYIENNKIDYSHIIKGKLVEIDKGTIIKNETTVFLQILHDRDDAILKKKLGEQREIIDLDDDEYISEFTSILYNQETNILMSQYNKYAVSIGQLGHFFSVCLADYFQYNLNDDEKFKSFPVRIELIPIIDKNRLDRIKNNKCVERMTIKGSLSSLKNIKGALNTNYPIFNISKSISSVNASEFNLTITANKTREGRKIEYESISQDFCSDLYDAYENVGNKDNIDVEMQFQNEDNIREILKWSTPIKEVYVSFSVDSRKEIPFEDIHNKMIQYI